MPAIILLAAGASSRLGQPKQLLPFEGKSLLRRAAETAIHADLGPVVVVTGALHEELLPELAGLQVAITRNESWERGMGASIKAGLRAAEALAPLTGVLIMLCDQPLITSDLLRALQQKQLTANCPIVATEYAEIQGVPALFGKEVIPLLRSMSDEAGARQLLRQHPNKVATVPFSAASLDVDTPAQYEQLLQQAKGTFPGC
ncbi:nucleotidyltransferase family protein [Hymenobacter sp. BT730]|uniref:nucleotidyltransferase family protein n=1 Tax=Hymenobacter sp. BT730 TaxID=3063332 RepID=UPI0026E096C3|nr:nucleotidyltransferase family protein [Hymenobacter sp. BT730]